MRSYLTREEKKGASSFLHVAQSFVAYYLLFGRRLVSSARVNKINFLTPCSTQ